MNFSIEEIDNMTTHESASYTNQFKELKTKEREAIEKAKSALKQNRLSRRGKSKKGG